MTKNEKLIELGWKYGILEEDMRIIWGEAQKEQLLEIVNNSEWSNGEILEYINKTLKDLENTKNK